MRYGAQREAIHMADVGTDPIGLGAHHDPWPG